MSKKRNRGDIFLSHELLLKLVARLVPNAALENDSAMIKKLVIFSFPS